MAFIENFLIPLFQAVFFIAIILLFFVGIYFLLRKFTENKMFRIRMWWKHKLMKSPQNEDMVNWSLDMTERKIPKEELKLEFYTTNKFKLGQFQEGMYVYNQVKKMQKGGYN